MPQKNEQMLTVGQVLEIPAGDRDNASWINPGLIAAVAQIELIERGKKRWKCTLEDPDTGAAIEMTLFSAPKFRQGDSLEIAGQGLRRTEFNGTAQVSIGQKTTITVIGGAGDAPPRAAPAARPATAAPSRSYDAPRERLGASRDEAAIPTPVFGATVGMAINQTFELMRHLYTPAEIGAMLKAPSGWQAVHELASDIIRVSRLLELGKLAPAIKDRIGGIAKARDDASLAPEPPARAAHGYEEDVPF